MVSRKAHNLKTVVRFDPPQHGQMFEAIVRLLASQYRHALLDGEAIDKKQSSLLFVGVAQLVERGTHKPEVTGSFPVADTLRVT